MNTKRLYTYLALFLLTVTVLSFNAGACDRERLAQLAGIAVSRCINREVSLSFDGPVVVDGDRTFVTMNDADAKRLHAALDAYYGKKSK